MDDLRQHITLGEREVFNVHSTDYPGTYSAYDDIWSFDKFKKNFKVDIVSSNNSEMELEFDFIGIDAAIANSVRRVLLAEVPSIAIEKVFMYNNTSLMQDEVLAHRLGLVPIKADPRLFEYRQDGDTEGTAEDTLEYELKVRCKRNPNVSSDVTDPKLMYIDHHVTTKHLKWIPRGNQSEIFKEIQVRPVGEEMGDDNCILINKLRPGQEMEVKMHAVKGIGKDHAKFSPVATASYRLLPKIILKSPFINDAAVKLQSCFAPGVIGIKEKDNIKEAYVADARLDNCSREVFRHEDLKENVELKKVRNHFIYTVESTGALYPNVLVTESIKILMRKCQYFLQELEDIGDG